MRVSWVGLLYGVPEDKSCARQNRRLSGKNTGERFWPPAERPVLLRKVCAERAKPESQRPEPADRKSRNVGPQPVLPAVLCHGPHDAEIGGVAVFPGITTDQPGQYIKQTEQQDSPTRQGQRGRSRQAYRFGGRDQTGLCIGHRTNTGTDSAKQGVRKKKAAEAAFFTD